MYYRLYCEQNAKRCYQPFQNGAAIRGGYEFGQWKGNVFNYLDNFYLYDLFISTRFKFSDRFFQNMNAINRRNIIHMKKDFLYIILNVDNLYIYYKVIRLYYAFPHIS